MRQPDDIGPTPIIFGKQPADARLIPACGTPCVGDRGWRSPYRHAAIHMQSMAAMAFQLNRRARGDEVQRAKTKIADPVTLRKANCSRCTPRATAPHPFWNRAGRRAGRGERTGQPRQNQQRYESIGIYNFAFTVRTVRRTQPAYRPSLFFQRRPGWNRIELEKNLQACYYSCFSSSQEAFPEAIFKYAPRQSQRKRAV